MRENLLLAQPRMDKKDDKEKDKKQHFFPPNMPRQRVGVNIYNKSYLKKRTLIQDLGGSGFHPASILQYLEDLRSCSNTQIGPKDFFADGFQ